MGQFADISLSGGSALGTELERILMADEIQPGSVPSYQLCKTLYTTHPLGGKMVDGPLELAQSDARQIAVGSDTPDEVLKAFQDKWEEIGTDEHIANTTRLSRIYGIGTQVVGCVGVPSDKPLDLTTIWDKEVFFNELDPLNTSGSLVLNQNATAPDFNKPVRVSANGQAYHRSRFRVVMNESPIFIEYTPSAFGFVGRSVYQRALYPMKSFIRSMVADDMIATKLGVLIAKTKAPGSVVNSVMGAVAAIKRLFVKEAQTGNVITIDPTEDIETLNMMNVDGAGAFARGNILKNIATAAPMPAVFLENETLTEGFGEGTEDAKAIALYIDGIRRRMRRLYAFHDTITQYRAWNPDFYKTIQRKYSQYSEVAYEVAFSQWRNDFSAEWPSLLKEPESEAVEVENVKFQMLIATVQTLIELLDPYNRKVAIQWLADSINGNKLMFTRELVFDYDTLDEYLAKLQERSDSLADAAVEGAGEGGTEQVGGEAKKLGRFDSMRRIAELTSGVNESIARLQAGNAERRQARQDANARSRRRALAR